MAAKKTGTEIAVADAIDPKVKVKLDQHAQEINVRFEKADKLDGQADDHRLAAAIKLASAKQLCEDHGVGFKNWCVENVKQSYETARKLVAVGAAKDPKAALEDMRGKNKEANRKLREAQASEAIEHKPAPEPENEIVPLADLDLGGLELLKKAFDALRASEKMDFMEYCAAQTGVELKTGFDADAPSATPHPFDVAAAAAKGEEVVAGNAAIEEIPANLRRRKRAA